MPRPPLIMLAPIMPAATGNGLAMRAGAQLRALSEDHDVRLVVVPVAGGSRSSGWAERFAPSPRIVTPEDEKALRSGITRLVGDPVWRDRFARSAPFPDPVTYASPALAGQVVAAARATGRTPVHALRAYLAPLATAVAELTDAPWATLDLDDDVESLLAFEGSHHEANAYRLLIETFGPAFAWVSLASREDAARFSSRHGLRTTVLPNSIVVPSQAVDRSTRDPGRARLLYVGNLTYPPNIDAAIALLRDVAPKVRRLVDRPIAVELVGRYTPGGRVEPCGDIDGVELRGYVDDLDEVYARADVIVVALDRASGTRIKLLEALAMGVPVVTSSSGAAGLGVVDGVHLLLADDADAQALAVARILADDGLVATLVANGRAFVQERFSATVVGDALRAQMRELVTSTRRPSDYEPVHREP